MHFTMCFARFQNVCENVAKLQKTRVVKKYGFFQLKRIQWSSPGRLAGMLFLFVVRVWTTLYNLRASRSLAQQVSARMLVNSEDSGRWKSWTPQRNKFLPLPVQ